MSLMKKVSLRMMSLKNSRSEDEEQEEELRLLDEELLSELEDEEQELLEQDDELLLDDEQDDDEQELLLDEELLEELKANGQAVWRYCDTDGQTTEEFPINPNGTVYNLAGVCNLAGNVMALMPHPERTVDGQCIFESMREYIDTRYEIRDISLKYQPKQIEKLENYKSTKQRS